MSKKDTDEYVPSRYRKEDALKDLDDLEMSSFILPSTLAKKEEYKKPKEEKVEIEDDYYDTEWMDTLSTLRIEKKRYKKVSDIFGQESSGQKKKKKKDKDGPKDHTEDFEKEVALLQDILRDQSKLSDSLQTRYDALNNQKSSARGVGKFTTDLISTLNTSRSLCKDIVKEIASIKKTTAELNMKEREKFGKNADADGDMGQFASSYLKKIMGANADLGSGSGDYGIDDVSDASDFFDDLDFNMRSSDDFTSRSSDAEKFLKYENQKVEVKVVFDEENDIKEFIAETEDGDILDDYPLPNTEASLSINRSTGIATDKYGKKYKVIFR